MSVPDEPLATRREVDQLARRIDQNADRISGIGIVQVQLSEVIKDVARLEAEVNARFTAHAREHDREAAERVNARRWSLGFAVAGLAAIGGLYPYVQAIAHK